MNGVSEEEKQEICAITDSFGCTEVIPERLMEGLSAVTGCSPAICIYVFGGNGRCGGTSGNAKKTGIPPCGTGCSRKCKNAP
mgnify:CR=1 FL=1